MAATAHGEAQALLREHAARAEAGALRDPAALAAVVGVERLALAAGTTDAERLRSLLADPEPGVRDLVAEILERVGEGLAQRAQERRPDAGMINADAGHHVVSLDPAALRAAVRAAHATWVANPYYEQRYGRRGSRFAGSDSAWLVGLASVAQEQAVAHAQWLARLLAARGMPSWLLEQHLADLAAELRRALGDGAEGVLPGAAEALRTRRRRIAPDSVLDLADEWALAELGDRLPVPRTGALLVAALVDVRSELAADDASLADWLTDPRRVPDAVAGGVRRVRDRIHAALPARSRRFTT